MATVALARRMRTEYVEGELTVFSSAADKGFFSCILGATCVGFGNNFVELVHSQKLSPIGCRFECFLKML